MGSNIPLLLLTDLFSLSRFSLYEYQSRLLRKVFCNCCNFFHMTFSVYLCLVMEILSKFAINVLSGIGSRFKVGVRDQRHYKASDGNKDKAH